MAKLYFKYGVMGSSKSAQALITKFNYEEKGMTVWLIKPSIDTRDGANIIRSRIGLRCEAEVITPETDLIARYHQAGKRDVIIADEAQFFTPEQIDELRTLVDEEDLPVLCFGLRTDFLTHFFPRRPAADGAGGLADGDQDRLRMRPEGDGERPDRRRRADHDQRGPGDAGRERQLHRHVPPVLEAENPRTEPGIREKPSGRRAFFHAPGSRARLSYEPFSGRRTGGRLRDGRRCPSRFPRARGSGSPDRPGRRPGASAPGFRRRGRRRRRP